MFDVFRFLSVLELFISILGNECDKEGTWIAKYKYNTENISGITGKKGVTISFIPHPKEQVVCLGHVTEVSLNLNTELASMWLDVWQLSEQYKIGDNLIRSIY